MGCSHNFICSCRICYFVISILFLTLSSTQLRSTMAEARGRALTEPFSQTERQGKAILRGRIGSRPPRCERRCNSCGHCEAIQVPANPQLQNGNKDYFSRVSNFAYSRGDDSSNYKPISWKCKCGNFIFNP